MSAMHLMHPGKGTAFGQSVRIFVGTRTPVPEKVREPLPVIIELDSGRQVACSPSR